MTEVPPTAGLPLRWPDLVGRSETLSLETELAEMLGLEAPQITCSGTAALVIALQVLRQSSSRDEVVLPAYTCPLVALAVAHCGLTVRVCDLATRSFALDDAGLDRLCGPRTLAIVPTHLCGRVTDLRPVLEHARRAGAWVIEDAAQALGARHADGAPVGLSGDIGFFSMAAGKGLTTYEGGILVTRHASLRARLAAAARSLAPARPAWELRRCIELLGYALLYRPATLAMVYGAPLRRALRRDDPIAAAGDVYPPRIPLHGIGRWRKQVAARAANRLPDHLAACAAQAARRMVLLDGIPGLHVLGDPPGSRGAWPVLPVLVDDPAARDRILAEWWGAGVGISVPFAKALPDYPTLAGVVPAVDVPRARALAATLLTLSNSPFLDDARFSRVAAGIDAIVNPGMRPAAQG